VELHISLGLKGQTSYASWSQSVASHFAKAVLLLTGIQEKPNSISAKLQTHSPDWWFHNFCQAWQTKYLKLGHIHHPSNRCQFIGDYYTTEHHTVCNT